MPVPSLCRRLAGPAVALALLGSAMVPAAADLLPIPPHGPAPDGPASAIIHGLSVEQLFSHSDDGWGWRTSVVACLKDAQCALVGCFITAVDGQAVPGGDLTALEAAADRGGATAAIRVTLDRCRVANANVMP